MFDPYISTYQKALNEKTGQKGLNRIKDNVLIISLLSSHKYSSIKHLVLLKNI